MSAKQNGSQSNLEQGCYQRLQSFVIHPLELRQRLLLTMMLSHSHKTLVAVPLHRGLACPTDEHSEIADITRGYVCLQDGYIDVKG